MLGAWRGQKRISDLQGLEQAQTIQRQAISLALQACDRDSDNDTISVSLTVFNVHGGLYLEIKLVTNSFIIFILEVSPKLQVFNVLVHKF